MHAEIRRIDAVNKTTGVKHLKSLLMKTGLTIHYFLFTSKIAYFKEICHKDRGSQGEMNKTQDSKQWSIKEGIFNDLLARRQKELQKEIRKKSPAESQRPEDQCTKYSRWRWGKEPKTEGLADRLHSKGAISRWDLPPLLTHWVKLYSQAEA